MEKELKELERRVSRLENVTGNTYDFYCSNQYLMLPIELLKLGVFNYDEWICEERCESFYEYHSP